MATEPRRCSDCQGAMHEIKLIDKAHYGTHTDLEYVLPESKRSLWTANYPVEGRVAAFLCSGCGRIALYGAI